MHYLLPSETTWTVPPLLKPPILSQIPLVTNKTSSVSHINASDLSPQPIKTPLPSILYKLTTHYILPSETTWTAPPLLKPPVLSQNTLLTNKTSVLSHSTSQKLSPQPIKTPISYIL